VTPDAEDTEKRGREDWDRFGKDLLKLAAGPLFLEDGPSVSFSFGPGAGSARIGGTGANLVAVEVESRAPKQVRGALVDLVCHPLPKKLLPILPVYAGHATTATKQAEATLGRFSEFGSFRVVCATGANPEEIVESIRTALRELGVKLGAG
jgi:hypothetical protein